MHEAITILFPGSTAARLHHNSPYLTLNLTLISDVEACCRATVVGGEQQEEDVGCGNQEMRSLGAVVFANQGRRG